MFQAFNILRYEIGQKYDAHYDAFNPVEYGPQPSQRVRLMLNINFLSLLCNHIIYVLCNTFHELTYAQFRFLIFLDFAITVVLILWMTVSR